MSYFVSLIVTILSICPAWFAIIFVALMAFIVIICVIRVVAAVLDAIPFL